MKSFSEIAPQVVLDSLCAEYRRLETHLGSPRYAGHPLSNPAYCHVDNGKTVWRVSKYIRNLAALDKFEAFTERLDPLWISIEYFNGQVQLNRTIGEPLTKAYTDELFVLIAADALRSSLDIFSKVLGWYFGLEHKQSVGFEYGKLIKPLREKSAPVSELLNRLYNAEHFTFLKSLRDADKHIGFGKPTILLEDTPTATKVSLTQADRIEIARVESCICATLTDLCTVVAASVTELQKWPLGYDCADDREIS